MRRKDSDSMLKTYHERNDRRMSPTWLVTKPVKFALGRASLGDDADDRQDHDFVSRTVHILVKPLRNPTVVGTCPLTVLAETIGSVSALSRRSCWSLVIIGRRLHSLPVFVRVVAWL